MNASDDRRKPADHRIRLDSQWDLELLTDVDSQTTEPPNVRRLKHLSDFAEVASAESKGRLRLTRRFGRPTGLTPHDRLELVGSGFESAATVSLNDRVLTPLPVADRPDPGGGSNSLRYDVSEILQERNELVVEFSESKNPDAAGMISNVRVEIFVGRR